MNVYEKMQICLTVIFGEMVVPTIERQKEKLGLKDDLTRDDYLAIANNLKGLIEAMAGDIVAEKIHGDLLKIIEGAT